MSLQKLYLLISLKLIKEEQNRPNRTGNSSIYMILRKLNNSKRKSIFYIPSHSVPNSKKGQTIQKKRKNRNQNAPDSKFYHREGRMPPY